MRGFRDNSLGPKAIDPVTGENLAQGGQTSAISNLELFFAVPGVKENSRVFRLSVFVDAGNIWGTGGSQFDENVSFSSVRVSAGLGFSWISPIGPLKLSWGKPLNAYSSDELQSFQFQIGQVF